MKTEFVLKRGSKFVEEIFWDHRTFTDNLARAKRFPSLGVAQAHQGEGELMSHISWALTCKPALILDNRAKLREFHNLHALPEPVQIIIKSAETIRPHGFQEIIGYQGRQAIWSCGGYWTDGIVPEHSLFHVESVGDGTQLYKE